MTKTSLIVKMTAKSGQRDDVLAALMAVMPAAEAEEGTEVYSFHLDRNDPDTVWVFELYADDAALAAHAQSPAVAEMFAAVGPLLAEPPMLTQVDLHAAKGL